MEFAQAEKYTVADQSDGGIPQMTTWNDLLEPGIAADFFSRRLFLPFDPASRAYNPANALWLAELSRLVYRHDQEEDTCPPQPRRTALLERAGFKQRNFFVSHATDTQAMLLEVKSHVPFAVLVFRGTEQNIKDVVMDLTLGKLSLGQGKIDVHEGFKQALDSVWDEIEAALQQLYCPIFFTGHSLGGALATLAAARHPPTALYTFGSPRVGNAAFVASLNSSADTIHRIVNDDDIVTNLPPTEIGFQHVGTLHTLPTISSLSWLNPLFCPPKFLADHAPVNYVDKI
jgi:hypothetical protein